MTHVDPKQNHYVDITKLWMPISQYCMRLESIWKLGVVLFVLSVGWKYHIMLTSYVISMVLVVFGCLQL